MQVVLIIFLALLALMVFAILADIVTWIYSIAWIFPIIILLFIAWLFWRKSMFRKKMKIKQLIKAAWVDGKISDKERHTIIRKAISMRMDACEAEIYVESILYQLENNTQNFTSKKNL